MEAYAMINLSRKSFAAGNNRQQIDTAQPCATKAQTLATAILFPRLLSALPDHSLPQSTPCQIT
jgi:hypothetical protein